MTVIFRPLWRVFFCAFLLALPCIAGATDVILRDVPARVIFPPAEKQIQALAAEMENATMEILVLSASLNSSRVAQALQGAAKRAVSVEVITDRARQTNPGGVLAGLIRSKIPVFVDDAHSPLMDEVIVIDKTTVVTGAFRLAAGGSASGNMLIMKSKELAAPYVDNWLAHKAHSRAFKPQAAGKAAGKKKKRP